MESSEFSETELRSIIDTALNTVRANSGVPLSVGGSSLLQTLAEKLPKYMDPSDAAFFISELRESLYEGINTVDIKDLMTMVKNCSRCPGVKYDRLQASWNTTDPDLFIVFDRPFFDSSSSVEPVINSLKAAGFSSSRVCASYLTRCKAEKAEPQAEKCSTYLFSEIAVTKPKLVIVLGSATTSFLLGPNAKIKDLEEETLWVGAFPFMFGFSPAYLVRGTRDPLEYYKPIFERAHTFCYGT